MQYVCSTNYAKYYYVHINSIQATYSRTAYALPLALRFGTIYIVYTRLVD